MIDQMLYGIVAFASLFCLFCGGLLWRNSKNNLPQRYLSYLLFYMAISYMGTFFMLRSGYLDMGIIDMRISSGACFFAMCTAFYPVESVFPKYLRGVRLLYLLGPWLAVFLISTVLRVMGVEQYTFRSLSEAFSYWHTSQLWMRLVFALLPFYYSIFIVFLPFGVRKTVVLPRWMYIYMYGAIGVFFFYLGIAFVGWHVFYLIYMVFLLIVISVLVYFIWRRSVNRISDDLGIITPLMKE